MAITGGQDAVGPVTRQAQIIVGALIAGVSFFLVLAVILDLGPGPGAAGPGAQGGALAPAAGQPGQSMPFLTYIAVAFAAISLPLSVIVPGLVAKQQRLAIASGKPMPGIPPAATSDKSPEDAKKQAARWPLAYLNQLIVGAAINEGAAFLAGVAYLIEKNPIALFVALVLIAGLVARFPTVGRVERWIEEQQEKLRQEGVPSPYTS